MADLDRVNDRLDQAPMMDGVWENSLAGKFKALLQAADRSNVELEWHVFN